MIELNLLPDVKLQYVRAQKARRRVISIVSIGGVIAVGAVVVFAIVVYPVQWGLDKLADNDISKSTQDLANVKDLNNYLTLQQQLSALPKLHEAKPIYSRFISYLPILNPSAPNNIHVTQLMVNGEDDPNTLTLQAYASTYTAATVFQSTLESAQFTADGQDPTDLFSNVTLTNTALGQDSSGNKVVTFTVTVTVSDDVFSFDSTNASISVPNKNATNSAQNIPSEVFASVGGTQ